MSNLKVLISLPILVNTWPVLRIRVFHGSEFSYPYPYPCRTLCISWISPSLIELRTPPNTQPENCSTKSHQNQNQPHRSKPALKPTVKTPTLRMLGQRRHLIKYSGLASCLHLLINAGLWTLLFQKPGSMRCQWRLWCSRGPIVDGDLTFNTSAPQQKAERNEGVFNTTGLSECCYRISYMVGIARGWVGRIRLNSRGHKRGQCKQSVPWYRQTWRPYRPHKRKISSASTLTLPSPSFPPLRKSSILLLPPCTRFPDSGQRFTWRVSNWLPTLRFPIVGSTKHPWVSFKPVR